MELTLYRFLKILRNKIWLIILITIIFTISAFIISNFLIRPKFKSTTTFQINVQSGTTDIDLARRLKPDYKDYTESEAFLQVIATELNGDEEFNYYNDEITVGNLKSYIVVDTRSSDSSQFDVIITSYDANVSYYISNVIANKADTIFKTSGKFSTSTVAVINFPKENFKPVSPNTTTNVLFGFVLGVIISCLLIIIIETIDNSITDENDLIDFYEIPLLGVVYTHRPTVNENITGKKIVGAKS